jgi:uncharacterized alkaline shock family protein YloU
MGDENKFIGRTTIAPDVLTSIARLSALSVEGVSHLAPIPGGVDRLFKHGANDGVRISVQGNTVNADLFLIMKKDQNIREVSREVQSHVARAISEMVGMEVGRVNVHVEDIDFNSPPAP